MRIAVILGLSIAVASGAAARDDLNAEDRRKVDAVLAAPTDFAKAEPFEARPAGAGTVRAVSTPNAFSLPSDNLSFEDRQDFFVGNGLFKKLWVSSPSSTQASDGLGPLFNARACQRCHIKDGRGHPPASADDNAISMLIRLSVLDADGSVGPDPTYGGQLQDFAVPGLPAEGRFVIDYETITVDLAGGETAELRRPTYRLVEPGYGPFADGVQTSPRIAPPMIGLGLLEAIHQDDILAQADPDDADGDGVSGRARWVDNPLTGERQLGRFGWKLGNPTLRAQNADAFANDIGISTPDFARHWGDCTAAQPACLAAATGVQPRLGDSEAPDPVLDLITFYSANLAVPARRNVDDPAVLRGKQAFYEAGCVACHTPKYVTRRDAERPEHQFQLIWPYTDLLLHDMGEGLSDGRTLPGAEPGEWRTPPLWGIGLTKRVNGHSFFLHDGRARSLLEAVLWHGGEAQTARDAVVEMAPDLRADLISFLESL